MWTKEGLKSLGGLSLEKDILDGIYQDQDHRELLSFPKLNVYLKTCFRKYKIFNMNDRTTDIFFFKIRREIDHKSFLSFA